MAMTDSRLEAIRVATEADQVMTALKQIILKGWPDERIHAPPLVQIYFAFRDELAIHDGIVFRGERVVVPASQRSVVKEKIHSSHLGLDGCLRRAKECLFWPNMTSEIRGYIYLDMQHLQNLRISQSEKNTDEPRHPRSTLGQGRHRSVRKGW